MTTNSLNYRQYQEGDEEDIVNCIVEGFSHLFHPLTKDKNKLCKLLHKILRFEDFWVVDKNLQGVGCISVSDIKNRPVKVNSKDVIEIFGYIKGIPATKILKDILEVPYNYQGDIGYCEFLCISKNHRNEGHAQQLLKTVINESGYDEIMLDVITSNKKAYQLYSNLGFEEVGRNNVGLKKIVGHNSKIIMKYEP